MRTQIVLIIVLMLASSAAVNAQKGGRRTTLSLTERNYHLRNVANGKYIDIPGYPGDADTDNGADVQLWDLDEGEDRKVKFVPAGGDYYYIRVQHARMNLDVHGCYKGHWFCGTYKTEKGANVQIWSAGKSKPQQWKLEQINPGEFRIINRYSNKVLDAAGSGLDENGGNVHQWTWHGGDNQLWELVDVKTGSRYQE